MCNVYFGSSFGGFSPWAAGSKAETWWQGVVGQSCPPHGSQEIEHRRTIEKGPEARYTVVPKVTPLLPTQTYPEVCFADLGLSQANQALYLSYIFLGFECYMY